MPPGLGVFGLLGLGCLAGAGIAVAAGVGMTWLQVQAASCPAVFSLLNHVRRRKAPIQHLLFLLQWAEEQERGPVFAGASLMSPHEQKTRDSLPSSSARRKPA